jgi:hypothetical protein
MLAFQRSIYQVQLKNKLEFWSDPQNRKSYFANLPTNANIKDFGIFRDENGYIYVRDDFVAYYNLRNGLIVRIRKDWFKNDWSCYQELYNKSQELKTFRIDIPKYREELSMFDGSVWEYSELQSPGSNYGLSVLDTIFDNGITHSEGVYLPEEVVSGSIEDLVEYISQYATTDTKDNTKKFFVDYIDNFLILLKESSAIAEKYKCGLPLNLGDPSMMYEDPQGYFWSDVDKMPWMYSKLEIVSNAHQILHNSLNYLSLLGHIDKERIDQCLDYARTQWTTI